MVFTGDIEQIDSPYLDTASNDLATFRTNEEARYLCHVNLVKENAVSSQSLPVTPLDFTE